MKIIILDPARGVSRTMQLPRQWKALLAAVVLVLPLAGIAGGYWLGTSADSPVLTGKVGRSAAEMWQGTLSTQRDAVTHATRQAENRLRALTLRVAEMQAKLLRLDALGERLARVRHVGKNEFDFSVPPAVGGPEDGSSGAVYAKPDFVAVLDDLAERIDAREKELKVLQSLVDGGRLREESFLSGNPVRVGYLSSNFGRRIDPFEGNLAFHRGVDFAGPEGSDIVATGDGIIVEAGVHTGYGLMIEVSHGDGISTVYAHCEKLVGRVGEIVREGQVIAKLGSTGRSTGPHVHYEVRRNGVAIDPAAYVASARTGPARGG